jgi:hypothetical protein
MHYPNWSNNPTDNRILSGSFYEKGIRDHLKDTINTHFLFNEQYDDKYNQDFGVSSSKNYRGYYTEKEEVQRRDYIKQVVKQDILQDKVDVYEEAARALARNAFSAFSSDLYNLSTSGIKAINRITGEFNIGLNDGFFESTLSEKEKDKRRIEYERYTSSVAYRYLFDHDTTEVVSNEVNKNIYGGLKILKENPNINDLDGMAKGRWVLNHLLTGEEYQVTNRVNKIHDELIRTDPEILLKRMDYGFTTSTSYVKDFSTRLLDKSDYVYKPGVRMAIAFIESADKELTIDLFQLQNKTISDVLVSKLQRESSRIASGDFKFSIRLAAPSNGSNANMVGHQILGPNIIIMERIYRVQKDIVKEKLISLGVNDVETLTSPGNINNTIANYLPNMNLEFIDSGSYHPKLYTTEKFAMLGSFNLTSPVGNSPSVAGSNYEEVIILHNRLDRINPNSSSYYIPDMDGVKRTALDIRSSFSSSMTKEKKQEYIDTHLYLQARMIALNEIKTRRAVTGNQIGNAGDIGQGLRTMIKYASSKSTYDKPIELYANLNQVWLLQLDDDIYYGKKGDYSGEFGPSGKSRTIPIETFLIRNKGNNRDSIYRSEIQYKFFELVNKGRAYVSVDIRNYRDKVLEPTIEKVSYLLGRMENTSLDYESTVRLGSKVFEDRYSSSLRTLTNAVNRDSKALINLLGLDKGGVNYGVSIDKFIDPRDKLSRFYNKVSSESSYRTALQILAITSGNIIEVTETMSHVKNIFAIQRYRGEDDSFKHIGAIQGSSNFGSSSLAFDVGDDTTSGEVGIINLARDMRRYGEREGTLYRSKDSMSEEMEDFKASEGQHLEREWFRLTRTKVGNVDSSLSSSKASWTNKVDRASLNTLIARLEALNKEMGLGKGEGISIKKSYGQHGELISIQVDINAGSLISGHKAGVTYNNSSFRVTALKGGLNNKSGFIYLIDQNKLVGKSLFINNQEETINLPYGKDSFTRRDDGSYSLQYKPLKSRESLLLTPIETFSNVISSLAGEMTYRALITQPLHYMRSLSKKENVQGNSMLGKAGLDYLEYLTYGRVSRYNGIAGDFLRSSSLSDIEITNLITKFEQRHGIGISGSFKASLNLRGGEDIVSQLKSSSLMSYQLVDNSNDLDIRTRVIKGLQAIRTINRALKDSNLSESNKRQLLFSKEAVIESIREGFDLSMGIGDIHTFQSDIALGIIESRREFMYDDSFINAIKLVKAGLLEPFITQKQVSTYTDNQAEFKTPLYGINRSQRVFLSNLKKRGDGISNIFRFAIAQPYIFGPSDTTGKGTEGAIRGVAEGGSISESIEEGGLSIHGIKKTPIGDIALVEFAKYGGVGYVTKRDEFDRYIFESIYNEYKVALYNEEIHSIEAMVNRLNEYRNRRKGGKSTFESSLIQKIDSKYERIIDGSGFKYSDEIVTYTYNVAKKVSQVPQRMKNKLGTRGMYEIDKEISYALLTKGNVNNIIEKRSLNIKVQVVETLFNRLNTTNSGIDTNTKKVLDNLKIVVQEDNIGLYSFNRLIEIAIDRTKGLNNQSKQTILHKLNHLYLKAESYLGEDLSIGIINASGFRGVMTSELASIVEQAKEELKEDFGFKEEDFEYRRGDISLARFMLLYRARSADSLASGTKGFTGTTEGLNPVILVQLTGDFSDYAYANPLYGGSNDDIKELHSLIKQYKGYKNIPLNERVEVMSKIRTMSGFIEKAEKKQKSSKLSEDWVSNGKLLARKGDIITFDTDTNRVLVWGNSSELISETTSGVKQSIELINQSKDVLSTLKQAVLGTEFNKYYSLDRESGHYVLKSMVDSRDQVAFLNGVIDNFRTIDDLPNVSRLDRQTWHRNAANSIEYLVSSKQLTGNADNNQLIWEMVYNRSFILEGGRRVEGIGTLAKAVLKFTSTDFLDIKDSRYQNMDFFSYLAAQFNKTQDGYTKVDVGSIFGLFNPTNLKSHFYSHGSHIVRNEQLLRSLISEFNPNTISNKKGNKLLLSLALAFGNEWMDSDVKKDINTILFESSIKGEMGSFFRNQALGTVISHLNGSSELVGAITGLGDFDTAINAIFNDSDPNYHKYQDIRTKFGSMFGNALVSKTKGLFNTQQTPSLALLDSQMLLKAAKGEQEGINYITSWLERKLVSDLGEGKGLVGREFIRIDNPFEREASILAGSLDLIAQLSKYDNDGITIPTEIDFNNNEIIKQIASIMGDVDLNKLERGSLLEKRSLTSLDKEEKESLDYLNAVRAMVRGFTTQSTVIRLFTDLLASESKESIGSKSTGALEYQHLLKPLMQVSSSFQEQGSISSLRTIVANMLSVVSDSATLHSVSGDIRDRDWIDKKVYDISDIRLGSQLHKSKFLGIYAGVDARTTAYLNQYKKDYESYGALVNNVVNILIKELDSNNLTPESRIDTIEKINQLMTYNPSENEAIRGIIVDMKDKMGSGFDITGALTLLDNISSRRLLDISRYYQLHSDKPFGAGSVSPILDQLNYKSFAFSLPQIYMSEDSSNDIGGKVRLELDYSQKYYSYLMSGAELKGLGDAYGSYIDEIVSRTIFLASAFAPGTAMSNVRDKIVRAKEEGTGVIELDKEELILLKKFYSYAFGDQGIVNLMAEASAGTRAQAAIGFKTRHSGAVTSSAASWLIPNGSILLAKEALNRYTSASPERYELVSLLENIGNSSSSYKEQNVIRAALLAVRGGLSPLGMSYIDEVLTIKKEVDSLIGKLGSINQEDTAVIEPLNRQANSLLSRLELLSNIQIGKNQGDSLAVELAKLEAERIKRSGLVEGDIEENKAYKRDKTKFNKWKRLSEGSKVYKEGIFLIELEVLEDEINRIKTNKGIVYEKTTKPFLNNEYRYNIPSEFLYKMTLDINNRVSGPAGMDLNIFFSIFQSNLVDYSIFPSIQEDLYYNLPEEVLKLVNEASSIFKERLSKANQLELGNIRRVLQVATGVDSIPVSVLFSEYYKRVQSHIEAYAPTFREINRELRDLNELQRINSSGNDPDSLSRKINQINSLPSLINKREELSSILNSFKALEKSGSFDISSSLDYLNSYLVDIESQVESLNKQRLELLSLKRASEGIDKTLINERIKELNSERTRLTKIVEEGKSLSKIVPDNKTVKRIASFIRGIYSSNLSDVNKEIHYIERTIEEIDSSDSIIYRLKLQESKVKGMRPTRDNLSKLEYELDLIKNSKDIDLEDGYIKSKVKILELERDRISSLIGISEELNSIRDDKNRLIKLREEQINLIEQIQKAKEEGKSGTIMVRPNNEDLLIHGNNLQQIEDRIRKVEQELYIKRANITLEQNSLVGRELFPDIKPSDSTSIVLRKELDKSRNEYSNNSISDLENELNRLNRARTSIQQSIDSTSKSVYLDDYGSRYNSLESKQLELSELEMKYRNATIEFLSSPEAKKRDEEIRERDIKKLESIQQELEEEHKYVNRTISELEGETWLGTTKRLIYQYSREIESRLKYINKIKSSIKIYDRSALETPPWMGLNPSSNGYRILEEDISSYKSRLEILSKIKRNIHLGIHSTEYINKIDKEYTEVKNKLNHLYKVKEYKQDSSRLLLEERELENRLYFLKIAPYEEIADSEWADLTEYKAKLERKQLALTQEISEYESPLELQIKKLDGEIEHLSTRINSIEGLSSLDRYSPVITYLMSREKELKSKYDEINGKAIKEIQSRLGEVDTKSSIQGLSKSISKYKEIIIREEKAASLFLRDIGIDKSIEKREFTRLIESLEINRANIRSEIQEFKKQIHPGNSIEYHSELNQLRELEESITLSINKLIEVRKTTLLEQRSSIISQHRSLKDKVLNIGKEIKLFKEAIRNIFTTYQADTKNQLDELKKRKQELVISQLKLENPSLSEGELETLYKDIDSIKVPKWFGKDKEGNAIEEHQKYIEANENITYEPIKMKLAYIQYRFENIIPQSNQRFKEEYSSIYQHLEGTKDKPGLLQTIESLEGTYKKTKSFSFDEHKYLGGISDIKEKAIVIETALGEYIKSSSSVSQEFSRRARDTFKNSESQIDMLNKNKQGLDDLSSGLAILRKIVKTQSINDTSLKALERIFKSIDPDINIYSLLNINPKLAVTESRVVKGQVVNKYKLTLNESLLSNSIALMEKMMNHLDMRDSIEVLGFRSPPIGGSEQQRMALTVIQDISLLNQAIGQDSMVQYDEERNKGLSLLSPISLLTMNIGDFDGDPYTTIFSQFMDLQRSIESDSIMIKTTEARIRALDTSIDNKVGGLGPLSSYEDRLALEEGIKEEKTRVHILKSEIEEHKVRIANNKAKLYTWRNQLESSSFSKAVKKEVANYLGIRVEHFLGGPEGFQQNDISMNVALTFIEQGRGLFGGLGGTGSSIKKVNSILKDVFINTETTVLSKQQTGIPTTGNNGPNMSLFSYLASVSNAHSGFHLLQDRLKVLAQDETNANRNTYLGILLMGEEAQKDLLDLMYKSIQSIAPNSTSISKEQEEEILARASGLYAARLKSVSSLQSILGQGAGVNMSLTGYDMMVKIMGKAGGDVLGKTYNTFVGTLYQESPLLALSSIIQEESTKQFLRDNDFYNSQGIKEEDFVSSIKRNSDTGEGILAFIKSINQLLRDGIKPKAGGDFIANMERLSSEYESLSDNPDKQRALITREAGKFGPSGSNVGMDVFMQLGSLVRNRETLSEDGRVKLMNGVIVSSFWGGATSTKNEQILASDLSIDNTQYERLVQELNTFGNKEEISAFDIGALKVKRDLESLVIAYRYNITTGASGYDKGEQSSFLDTIFSGYIGIISRELGKDRDQVNGEDIQDFINKRFNSDTAEGSRNLHILSRIFNKNEEDIKSNYLNLDTNKGGAREVLSMLEIINTTTEFTDKMMGKYGEGLSRFTDMEGARQKTISLMGGNSSNTELLGADIWDTMLNLAGSNKLSSHAIPAVWDTFASNEFLKTNFKGNIPLLMTGIKKENGKIVDTFAYKLANMPEEEAKKDFQSRLALFNAIESGSSMEYKDENGNTINTTLEKYLSNKLETTASMAKGRALNEFLTKMYGKKEEIDSYVEGESFIKALLGENHGLSITEIEQIERQYNKATSEYRQHKLASLRTKVDTGSSNAYAQSLTPNFNNLSQAVQFNNINNFMELALPLALTTIGSAVINGTINPDAIGNIVGGTIFSIAYGKKGTSIDPKAMLTKSMIGGSFKLNMALSETDGDLGEAIGLAAAREIGFTLGASVVAPFVEKSAINSMMSLSHLSSYKAQMYREAKLSQLSSNEKLRYLFNSNKGALDYDAMGGKRIAAQSITSAVLSGLFGMVGAGIAGSMMQPITDNQSEFTIIERAIEAIDEQLISEAYSTEQDTNDPDIYSEDGGFIQWEEMVRVSESIFEGDYISNEFSVPEGLFAMVSNNSVVELTIDNSEYEDLV